jgi:hypothetical protein
MAQHEQMGDMAQPEQMTELLIAQFSQISCYFLSYPNSPVSILSCSKQKNEENKKYSKNIPKLYVNSTEPAGLQHLPICRPKTWVENYCGQPDPENGDTTLILNVTKYLPVNTV